MSNSASVIAHTFVPAVSVLDAGYCEECNEPETSHHEPVSGPLDEGFCSICDHQH